MGPTRDKTHHDGWRGGTGARISVSAPMGRGVGDDGDSPTEADMHGRMPLLLNHRSTATPPRGQRRVREPDQGGPHIIGYSVPADSNQGAEPCVFGQALVVAEPHPAEPGDGGRGILVVRLVCQTICPICMAVHNDALDWGDDRARPGTWMWSWSCDITPEVAYIVLLPGAEISGALVRRKQVQIRAQQAGWRVIFDDLAIGANPLAL